MQLRSALKEGGGCGMAVRLWATRHSQICKAKGARIGLIRHYPMQLRHIVRFRTAESGLLAANCLLVNFEENHGLRVSSRP